MPFAPFLHQRLPPITSAFTSSRIFLYTLLSLVATITTVANACRSHSSFYSVAIYLSRSGRSLLVRVTSLRRSSCLLMLVSGVSQLWFPMRIAVWPRPAARLLRATSEPRSRGVTSQSLVPRAPADATLPQRLYDQTWMFVTESLLAFTIFRDDFDIPFVIMFGFLLFIKCFHWLMADRVESVSERLMLVNEVVVCSICMLPGLAHWRCSESGQLSACLSCKLFSVELTFSSDGPGALPRPVNALPHTDELSIYDPPRHRFRDACFCR